MSHLQHFEQAPGRRSWHQLHGVRLAGTKYGLRRFAIQHLSSSSIAVKHGISQDGLAIDFDCGGVASWQTRMC
jgi:hypothetical protein